MKAKQGSIDCMVGFMAIGRVAKEQRGARASKEQQAITHPGQQMRRVRSTQQKIKSKDAHVNLIVAASVRGLKRVGEIEGGQERVRD